MNNSFLAGMGSAINLFPMDRSIDLPLPPHSDSEAFQKDLEQVGADMRSAMQSIELPEHSYHHPHE